MYELHLVLSAVFFIAIVASLAYGGYLSIFHPLTYYLMFHGLVFVVRPFFLYYLDFDTVYSLYLFHPDNYHKHLALLLANIGLISFTMGCLATGNTEMRFSSSRLCVSQEVYRGGLQLIIAAMLCAPLTIMSMNLRLSQDMTFTTIADYMSFDESTGRSINLSANGYVTDADAMFGAFAVLFAWVYRFKLLSLIPFFLFVFYRMYLGEGRWAFIMTSASLVLLYVYDKKKLFPAFKFVIYGMIFLFIFSKIGEYRGFVHDVLFNVRFTIDQSSTGRRKELF